MCTSMLVGGGGHAGAPGPEPRPFPGRTATISARLGCFNLQKRLWVKWDPRETNGQCNLSMTEKTKTHKWLWVKIPFWLAGESTTQFITYFSGDWDGHWGYDLDFAPWPNQCPSPTNMEPDARTPERQVPC